MRHQLSKLTRQNSTKYERRFCEFLKNIHKPFRAKVKICGREVDFIIGKYAIDIDGHEQNSEKNEILVQAGFIPIHFYNHEVDKVLIKILRNLI